MALLGRGKMIKEKPIKIDGRVMTSEPERKEEWRNEFW